MFLSMPSLISDAKALEVNGHAENDDHLEQASLALPAETEKRLEPLSSVLPSELELDDLLNYNVVVFGDFYGQRAEIEGSDAVQ